MKKEKWYNHNWVIGIGTAIVPFIVTLIIDFIKDYPLLDTFKKCINYIKSIIINTLDFNIKLWWLLIGIFLIYLFNRWKKVIASKPNRIDDLAETYRVDVFGNNNAKWTWKYERNGLNLTVIDVQPLCPQCETPSDIETRWMAKASAHCSRCRLEGKFSTFELNQHMVDVSNEIVRRLRSNEWQIRMKNVNQNIL